jgi:hypothetical protein
VFLFDNSPYRDSFLPLTPPLRRSCRDSDAGGGGATVVASDAVGAAVVATSSGAEVEVCAPNVHLFTQLEFATAASAASRAPLYLSR